MNIKSGSDGAKRPAGLLVMSSQTLRRSLQQGGGDNGEEEEERVLILKGQKLDVGVEHSR